ncbi:MAG: glycosyltransferase family 4 protein [Gemmatimonadota bacterium]|jgi:phosphatidylinositol alpha-1,6-mannosyltransferase
MPPLSRATPQPGEAAPRPRHLFVTQNYAPELGGIARLHVELCRRLAHAGGVRVSTVYQGDALAFDRGEGYPIERMPFARAGAKRLVSQLRWARRLVAQPGAVLHCGNIRPAGYAVWYAHRRTAVPYLVYAYGLDLVKEWRKITDHPLKRWAARRILGDSAGIVAISAWSAELARTVMREAGVRRPPPVAAIDLGTDPAFFRPDRDTGSLRRRFGFGDAPLLLTVARLVPHKGQDVALRALAALPPNVRYLVVGAGDDAGRLAAIAEQAGVADRVVFAGSLSDDEIAEAYATATVYVGLSREEGVQAEGFGIAFVEAAASGTPSVAGDSGGVRSAVRDGETGFLVPPTDPAAAAAAIRRLLGDPTLLFKTGRAARQAVETHYNWDRFARETVEFADRVTAVLPNGSGASHGPRR